MKTSDTPSNSPTPGSSPLLGSRVAVGTIGTALGSCGRRHLRGRRPTGTLLSCHDLSPESHTVDQDAFLPQERPGTASKDGGSPRGQQRELLAELGPFLSACGWTCSSAPSLRAGSPSRESAADTSYLPVGTGKCSQMSPDCGPHGPLTPRTAPASPLHGGGFYMSVGPRFGKKCT